MLLFYATYFKFNTDNLDRDTPLDTLLEDQPGPKRHRIELVRDGVKYDLSNTLSDSRPQSSYNAMKWDPFTSLYDMTFRPPDDRTLVSYQLFSSLIFFMSHVLSHVFQDVPFILFFPSTLISYSLCEFPLSCIIP